MAYRVLTSADFERIIDERIAAAQESVLATLEQFVEEVEARAAAKPRKAVKPAAAPAEPDAQESLLGESE